MLFLCWVSLILSVPVFILMPSVLMLSVVLSSVVLPSVILLSVVLTSVVAPIDWLGVTRICSSWISSEASLLWIEKKNVFQVIHRILTRLEMFQLLRSVYTSVLRTFKSPRYLKYYCFNCNIKLPLHWFINISVLKFHLHVQFEDIPIALIYKIQLFASDCNNKPPLQWLLTCFEII
jgi:hypothetical protein